MGTNVNNEQPLNHILFAVEVAFTFTDSDAPDGLHSRAINALIKTDVDHISLKTIGVAQQHAQANLFQLLGADAQIKVHDAVIVSATRLGWMTAEQFDSPENKPEPKKPNLTPVK